MKYLVILFVPGDAPYAFDTSLAGGSSAAALCVSWACRIAAEGKPALLCSSQDEAAVREAAGDAVRVVVRDEWTLAGVLDEMVHLASEGGYEGVVFSLADRPLLNTAITQEVIEHHERYVAEYTFADGYPEGLAPQVISAGTLSILASLAHGQHKEAGDEPFKAGSIWQLLQRDINSFEVESVLAPKDFRMLRLTFSCDRKRGFLACKRLIELAAASGGGGELSALELSSIAERSVRVQRTVPAFFDVQISGNCNTVAIYDPYPVEFKRLHGVLPTAQDNPTQPFMSADEFALLMNQVEELSGDAVVSLGSMGEPLLHPAFPSFVEAVLRHRGLRVLVETDGTLVTQELTDRVAAIVRNAGPRSGGGDAITWIVSLDSSDEAMYDRLITGGSFGRALSAVSLLHAHFPRAVYPQFTRMKDNEGQLEAFYRYWSDASSPSGGNVIIQKYDHYCHALPDRKSADLSPLERLPCWHIKRDMTVLSDGSVPLCRECMARPLGNAFTDGLAALWDKGESVAADHIRGVYPKHCEVCDEYYTFNF